MTCVACHLDDSHGSNALVITVLLYTCLYISDISDMYHDHRLLMNFINVQMSSFFLVNKFGIQTNNVLLVSNP